MWYTVESDKSTMRDEGEPACRLTHKNLSEIFRLPSFDAVTVGLSGDLSSLVEWSENSHVNMLPFTFENYGRLKFDLVPRGGNTVVGSVSYGASNTVNATFNRTSDARDILEMFYPHWLISYGRPGSDYIRISIREVVERL